MAVHVRALTETKHYKNGYWSYDTTVHCEVAGIKLVYGYGVSILHNRKSLQNLCKTGVPCDSVDVDSQVS